MAKIKYLIRKAWYSPALVAALVFVVAAGKKFPKGIGG
jgi:hypothetical protein